MRVAGGPVTYFRADSHRWPWTSHTGGPRYRRLGRPIARRAPGRKAAVAIPVGEQLNLLQEVAVTVLATN